ncbi:MFS general substrate transporter [Lojkania enalia]|uniref:MFS general substrate transporter n=1 Tax=Lojkania enalia TaxID=147567 RepID=A0A9P4K5E5_9PLEO|nr:MFS general substrate transporter [Didymosphaeria enalia]
MRASSPRRDDGDSTFKAIDERTPLLASTDGAPAGGTTETSPPANRPNGIHDQDEGAPLPLMQIALLCYCRVIEPLIFFSIFPYINKMIETTGGVETEDVGFYSGLIESLSSLTQMCVMTFWGKAADRFGRKPILVLSLWGVAVATALFGVCQSIWQMILTRALGGVFCGTIVTIRAMISENSTKKTQARAFSYFAFAGNLGIFTGPLLGGALESPAHKFKSIFGHISFFRQYPYALPGFVCAFVGASAAIVTALFVKETLQIHHANKKDDETSMSTWQLLKYPGVGQVVFLNNYVLLLAFAFTAIDPVFLYTPVNLGGIGFAPELIAAAIGLAGVSQAVWLLFAFPPLHRRIGTGGVLRLCAAAWPFFFAVNPLANILLRYNLKVPFWIVGPAGAAIGSGVAMAFTANQLAVNDIAPSHETFGTLNAIVLALAAGLRAFVPALSTSIYATGVKYHILWGHFFWVIAILLAISLIPLLKLLPEKAEGKAQHEENGYA